jgi:hypothetical protein
MRIGTPAAILTIAAAVVLGSPPAEAGSDLVVKRFLVGRLEPGTNRFIATGGRGTNNTPRDSVLMIVFSAPLDMSKVNPADPFSPFVHLNDRTIRIEIPTAGGLAREVEGTFQTYTVRRFNPSTGSFETRRTYRNRVIFEPKGVIVEREVGCPGMAPMVMRLNTGLEADVLHTVTVPGVDRGYTKTVEGRDGRPNLVTFTTTFSSGTGYLNGTDEPGPHPEPIGTQDF